jgi:hypothetical protein
VRDRLRVARLLEREVALLALIGAQARVDVRGLLLRLERLFCLLQPLEGVGAAVLHQRLVVRVDRLFLLFVGRGVLVCCFVVGLTCGGSVGTGREVW